MSLVNVGSQHTLRHAQSAQDLNLEHGPITTTSHVTAKNRHVVDKYKCPNDGSKIDFDIILQFGLVA